MEILIVALGPLVVGGLIALAIDRYRFRQVRREAAKNRRDYG